MRSPPALADKWIIHLLVSDAGLWSMPGIDDGFGGQCEEFCLDALHQYIKIACGEVGPANGVFEQDIARDNKTLGLVVQTDAALCMARSEEGREFGMAPAYHLAIFDEAEGLGQTVYLISERGAKLPHGLKEGKRVFMVFGPDLVGLFNEVVPQHMVDVAVGIDVAHGFQLMGCDIIRKLSGFIVIIAGGINHNTFFGFIVEQVGVHLKSIKYKSFYRNHQNFLNRKSACKVSQKY